MQPIKVTDMHTAGEPVRIVTGGYPALVGDSLLAKRADARAHHDQLRTLLMCEPRGHSEMYGVIPVTPSHPDADLAVLFMHGEGYSTMCGHATIAVARWAIEQGKIKAAEPTTSFTLECPCGPVKVKADVKDSKVSHVRFDSVPAYLAYEKVAVTLAGIGRVRVDIAYGGAYYAIVPASSLGMDLHKDRLEDLKARAVEITDQLRRDFVITHPTEPDLGFLYGTIITEGPVINRGEINHHLCFFAEGQLDRSPTGSGVTARLALAHARGEIAQGQKCCFKGVSGVSFGGVIIGKTRLGAHAAVTVQVGGSAFYTGDSTFTFEPEDPLPQGFESPKLANQYWRPR